MLFAPLVTVFKEIKNGEKVSSLNLKFAHVPTYSTIVEASPNFKLFISLTKPLDKPTTVLQRVKVYDIFQTYPHGLSNPAFTGMYNWELNKEHIMNE